jgi:hypothetical protein
VSCYNLRNKNKNGFLINKYPLNQLNQSNMKTKLFVLFLFVASYSFAQSVNDYKGVIVPLKYDFLKNDNQYRLSTLTKFNLKKAGFEAFYSNESVSNEYNDRCSLLYIDVKKENAFLITKLFITLKDCYGKIVFQSETGKSKEKDYESAYSEALNNAFQSVNELQYTYNGGAEIKKEAAVSVVVPTIAVAVPVVVSQSNNIINQGIAESTAENANLLYAQPTPTGFQLIDSEPKVVYKIQKTSAKDYYTASKGNIQGVFITKENQWYFEYYQNDKLVSEKVAVKF